jgi:hypothetical protein
MDDHTHLRRESLKWKKGIMKLTSEHRIWRRALRALIYFILTVGLGGEYKYNPNFKDEQQRHRKSINCDLCPSPPHHH